jgi:chlorite dismutase
MPGTGGMGSHTVDINEYGAERDGERQTMDRRLFMQMGVYEVPSEVSTLEVAAMLGEALHKEGAPAVIYEDVANPHGIGVLLWSEDPADFVTKARPVFAREPFRALKLQPEFNMLGRSYSSGFEPDLNFFLIDRPIQTVSNPEWPWAVWYPLRRSGDFARLTPREQGGILREHAVIGRAYGEKDLAHDVRLACHGLDKDDNEFVIGLVGKELYPLSHVVQSMRKTRQTSEYIVKMGPFFVGRACWQPK